MILENTIDIEAPREQVWEVTVDVESWPQWSPAMVRIVREDAGSFQLGSVARIKQKGMPETRWVVTEFTPQQSFSWQGKALGIEMIATHILIPRGTGVTSLLKVDMQGWMTRLMGLLIKPMVARALKEENRGLKNFCESS